MRGWITGALISLMLPGCVTHEQTEAMATREAQAQCAAKGGQFIKTETKTGSASLLTDYVTVMGNCVFPGEPGWVEPSS